MKLVCVTGLTALLLVISPGAASAAPRFAEVGGDGPEPCASGDPCSIQNAINNAVSGDDVTLLGGIPPDPAYSSTVPLNLASNVTVHGAPGARPVVNATPPSGHSFFLNSGATLRDVVIVSNAANTGAVLAIGGVVERVTAIEEGTNTVACGAGAGGVIRDSVCWRKETDPVAPNDAAVAAFGQSGGDTVTLRNVTAIANQGYGIHAISLGLVGQTIAVNAVNVIARGAGVVGQEDIRTHNVSAEDASQTVTLTNSNFATQSEHEPGDITEPSANNNQTTPPVFVDAANGDFHQTAASTGTLNLGTAMGLLMGELDFEGQARNQGPAPDIGADEAPAPPAPVLTGTDPVSPANNNNPKVFGTAEAGSTVTLYDNATCTPPAVFTGPESIFASPGFTVTVPDNSTTTFSAAATTGLGPSACSTMNVTYTEVTPPAPPAGGGGSTPAGTTPTSQATGQRAAALKKCKKKKSARARRNCKKRANKLPV